MRMILPILALSLMCFAFYPQPSAQAASGYDAQCKAAGGSAVQVNWSQDYEPRIGLGW
jgi:hypothetical protein